MISSVRELDREQCVEAQTGLGGEIRNDTSSIYDAVLSESRVVHSQPSFGRQHCHEGRYQCHPRGAGYRPVRETVTRK